MFISVLWLELALLTLSIATGMFFLQDMFDQRLVHHTVLTTLSWLVYAGFLAGHHFWLARRHHTACDGIWLLYSASIGLLGNKFVISIYFDVLLTLRR